MTALGVGLVVAVVVVLAVHAFSWIDGYQHGREHERTQRMRRWWGDGL